MARRKGGPVLDVATGTGRVLIPLARAGFEVTGIDIAPRMLAICRHKLAQESGEVRARIQLARADMCRFRLRRKFRLAVVAYCSFQFLTAVSKQLQCLESIRRHLLPGGRLVLDLYNPDMARFTQRDNFFYGKSGPNFKMADGRSVQRRFRLSKIDTHQQIVDIDAVSHVRYPGGQRERIADRLQIRFLYRFEAEHLLARAGFRIEKIYGDYDRSTYKAEKSRKMILVAVKT